jgi:hypothetical protein
MKGTVVDKAKVADVLEKAADLYESEKIEWCQGYNFNIGRQRLGACAQGAIMLATGAYAQMPNGFVDYIGSEDGDWNHDYELSITATRVLFLSINKKGPFPFSSVPQFNDTQGRTKQEVIEAMKKCAKELRNGE